MSLRTKVLLPLAAFCAVLLAYLSAYWMPRSLANIEEEYSWSIERHLDSVDETLIPLLLGHQLDAIYENLNSLMRKNKDWLDLQLKDEQGRLLYPLAPSPAADAAPGKHAHRVERRIRYLDRDLGSLSLRVDFAPRLAATKHKHWELMFAMSAGVLGFVVLTGFVLDRIVVRPVRLLSHASRRLAENDFDAPLVKVGEDEVGGLVEDFDGMRKAIRGYRRNLQESHERLRGELDERRAAEQALRESEKKYRVIVDTAAEGIWVLDQDAVTTFVNARMAAMVGFTDSEMIGRSFADFVVEGDRADHERRMQARRPGIAENYELRFRRKSGEVVWTHASATPLFEDGAFLGSFGMFTDITERKLAEERLRKSNEIVERILEMTTTCIAYLDRDFNFIRVNRQYAAADEKEPSYFAGKNHFVLFPNADNEAIFKRAVETGEPYKVRAKPFEYRNHPERGVSHWDWSLTPVMDAGGKVEALILSLINVTDRVQAQEELNALNEELEERIRKRTAELEAKIAEIERMNKVFVGRELRMKELKEKISELEKKALISSAKTD